MNQQVADFAQTLRVQLRVKLAEFAFGLMVGIALARLAALTFSLNRILARVLLDAVNSDG